MRSISWLGVLLAVLILNLACNQRTDPPPSNRDGVSNGTQEEGKSGQDREPRNGEDAIGREPEPDHNDPEYVPPAERSQLGDKEYTVVVGSFDRRERADQLSYELRMLRINNFVDRVNGRWHVCIGQYGSRGLAKNTLNRVREKGYYDAEIVGPGHASK